MPLAASPLEEAMMQQQKRVQTLPPQAPPGLPAAPDPMGAIMEKLQQGLPLSPEDEAMLNEMRKTNPELNETPFD